MMMMMIVVVIIVVVIIFVFAAIFCTFWGASVEEVSLIGYGVDATVVEEVADASTFF